MKRKSLFFALVCLIAVMSCDIPQSVTIKGKPELNISLGSPFASLGEGERLENLIGSAKIEEMMGKDGGLKIYDYQEPGANADPVQTYIVHYPIAEMKLDLAEYVRSATVGGETEFSYLIPDYITSLNETAFNNRYPNGCYLTRRSPPLSSEGDPLFTISLANMSKLVKKVEGGPFGLDLVYDLNFVNNIEVRIPALGINNYIPGQDITIDGKRKLRFVNMNKTEFEPRNELTKSGELEIYVRIRKPNPGFIEPEVVFEWEKATVDTTHMNDDLSGTNDDLSGTYDIENSLGKFLGNGVKFKEVLGRIYVGGVGDKATLTLKGNGVDLIKEESKLTDIPKRPSFNNLFNKELPDQSLGNTFIPLTDMLNAPGTSTLAYQIFIEELEIKADEVDEDKMIYADLVILLRLEFKVSTPPTYTFPNSNEYVKLDLGDALPQPGSGDLFGRTNSDNDLFSQIDTVELILKKPENKIIDVFILVAARDTKTVLDFNTKLSEDAEMSVKFNKNDLEYPFSPAFEVLLKKDNKDYATLKIPRQDPDKPAVFDFNLAITAVADLDYTITF